MITTKGIFRFERSRGELYDVTLRMYDVGISVTVVTGVTRDEAMYLKNELNKLLPNSPVFKGYPTSPKEEVHTESDEVDEGTPSDIAKNIDRGPLAKRQ